MQSRLEEEEEAKASLMSRIQRLTKLILVSSKNTIPRYISDMPSHHRSHSIIDNDKLDALHDGSLELDSENQKNSRSSALSTASDAYGIQHRRSSSKWNEDISQTAIATSETNNRGEISGSTCVAKVPIDGTVMSGEMDLLVEQVKMLAGEITFSTSTLKRLVEQSVNDPEIPKVQIQNVEQEMQEIQHIAESSEASVANASMIEMQQIKSTDNRVLQE